MEIKSDNIDKIAYLGIGGSYSEIAKDIFCNKYRIETYQTSLRTIEEIVDYVDTYPNTLGVIPYENQAEGIIRKTLDKLSKTQNSNIQILAEVELEMNSCLLSKNTEIYNITGIIAHPKALANCRDFIKNEMPLHVNIITANSMDESARLLDSYNLTYATIGTEKTAEVYNLNILKRDINDCSNKTRFILIGGYETPPTGNDKTSFIIKLEDREGALLEITQIIVENRINIIHVESRKTEDSKTEQMLYLDIEGHIKEEKIKKALLEIEKKSLGIRILGSYERD